MYIFIIILIIIACIVLYINFNNYFKSNIKSNIKSNKFHSSCWIEPKLYPEAQYIFDNKHIIEKELVEILNSNKWSRWLSYDTNCPTFTNMTSEEIKDKLTNSYGIINEKDDGSWRLYGLILNSEPLENSKSCPKTMAILSKVSKRILNAGFSVIEPGGQTNPHEGTCNKFYRLHIPLIIPQSNIDYYKTNKTSIINKSNSKDNLSIFQVEDDMRIWVPDEYFIFDDTCMHNAWNNTNVNRIVLLVDLLKN